MKPKSVLLQKADNSIHNEAIIKLIINSKSFEFLKDDDCSYSKEDLKNVY
jgi:hypothetical protein